MRTRILLSALAVAVGGCGRGFADEAFSDGFEGAAVSSFWTPVQINGTNQISATLAHGGTKSLRMARTTSGQLTLQLNHTFFAPQYGEVSVWFYDSGTSYYSYLIVGNSVVGVSSSIGVQDWDANHYYYHALNNAGGSASVARSGGWHFYAMSVTPTNQVISVDGVAVYSGVNGVGFDSVTLQTSGPGGSRSYYFDDFAFTPLAPAGTVEITGLKENGTLSWSNSSDLGDALFTIEWAPQLTGVWRTSWKSLSGMAVTGAVASVEVPMFFKVKACPDLLIPFPLNRQMTYAVSNAVGNVFTQQMAVLSYLRPLASSNEFAVLEQGGYNAAMMLLRSTSSSVYRYSSETGGETLEFQSGVAGTTWTNFNYAGSSDSREVRIEAIESVTVPAGTFRCYKFHKRVIGQAGADWYEWVCPGKGLVKWVDYWADSSENPPITYELQSSGAREP